MKIFFTLAFVYSLSCMSAQTAELDSLMAKANVLMQEKTRSLQSLSKEKSLRTDIENKLAVLLNAKQTSDSKNSDRDVIQRLDSLISLEYRQSISSRDPADVLKHRIALYDLARSKDAWMKLEAGENTPQALDKETARKRLAEQKERIGKINEEMAALNKPDRPSTEKESGPSDKAVFNENSIVSQLIASNIESGKSYELDIPYDNKGFEDRKAFMPKPLKAASVLERYSPSKGVIYESLEDAVLSVCQGEVVYAKRLAGNTYTVVIMHDKDYFTVYSGLSKVYVSHGDKVNFEQIIGTAGSSAGEGFKLSFEIWNRKKTVDPMHWVKNG